MSDSRKASVWFFGTSAFAVPSLEALIAHPAFSVDLVVTQPDRPTGRKQQLTASPVKIAAVKHGLRILQPENINAEIRSGVSLGSPPDFLVVVSFGQIFSQDVLDLPRIAPVNVHASLLPQWRGASPIHHAILAGDRETGVTIQKMTKELDAGPVLAQEKIAIDPRDTFTTLHDRLAHLGAQLLPQTLAQPLHPVAQDDALVTVCRKLTRKDGIVDPSAMTAEEIDRKVRALNPWPGVSMVMNGQSVKLLVTSLEPGMDSAVLPCTNGTVLHLVTVQPAGKKPMNGAEWKRGMRGMRGT